MNELLNNFINQIEDVNKIKEMTVEEFSKLVKSNSLISEEDAKQLIESFKKISSKKGDTDDTSDSDQRKKKYREQHRNIKTKNENEINKESIIEKEKDDDSIER